MKTYFLIFISLVFAAVTYAETITLATGDWAPYVSDKMSGYGVTAEIITAAFKTVGIEVKYSLMPWKRCEEEVAAGKFFATFPYAKTPERQPKFNFSQKFITSRSVFFFVSDKFNSFHWTTLADFKPYMIGGTLGYWYEADFKKAGLKTEFVSNNDSNFLKLLTGKVDFILEDELVGKDLVKRIAPDQLSKLKTLKPAFNTFDLHLMISKTFPGADELTKKFNEGLTKIRASGDYKKILAKYGFSE